GDAKKIVLRSGSATIEDMKITTSQISDLLIQLWLRFGGRYGSDLFRSAKKSSEDDAKKWLLELEAHDWMISELEAALTNEEWRKLGDASVSCQVIMTKKTLTEIQKKRKSAMSEYGPKPLNKKSRKD
ncbi:hypothetical protein BT96DRAFT_815562, partial [Gymnopus androsaceus JB14]